MQQVDSGAMFAIGSRALVLGAHTDDEFACAGTIARMIEEGVEVHYACFSSAEGSIPDGYDADVLKREVRAAIEVLGIEEERFRLYDMPVRRFPAHRQEILDELVLLRRELEPDLVLLPSTNDIHQDHATIADEGVRAFKHSTVLGYEHPQNTIEFRHACYVRLEERHLQTKIRHAATYRSQQFRAYLAPEVIRSLATIRGLQINHPAAEAFEVIRLTII
jgi:N-acetylglucosamine malate deacetylase 1